MYQNIVFDLGGVVVDFEPREFLVDHFMNEKVENALYNVTFGSNEWLRIDAGELTRAEGEAIMRRKASQIGRGYEAGIILSDWYDMLRTRDDTVQVMKRLKKHGYHIYYLSNIASDVLEMLQARKFWRLFEGGIASCDIGLIKPDLRIYQIFLETFQLAPEDCIFIDDNKANATAAFDIGMAGIHFHSARGLVRALATYGVRLEKRKHVATVEELAPESTTPPIENVSDDIPPAAL